MPQQWPARLSPIAFGGDYYPEQWPREVHEEDVRLMAEAGVTAVTVGVFAWALLEPAEGRYTFGWLDEVMDRMAAADIAVDLATPTASPPAWFSTAYPDTLPVTREGLRLGIGARESFCPSSRRYREAAAGIAGQLATRYGGHPALALWHVGNEFGAHVPACYCPASVAAFRTWLRARYGDLAGLNEAWGTTFWGQRYHDWAEVDVPRPAPMPVNPTQQLDFRRFCGAELLACFRTERDVLRELAPGVPVTTNFMLPACRDVDYWQWAGEVDVVGNDHYLDGEDPQGHVELALAADLSRSVAGGRPWLLLEHSTSAVNWRPRNIAKRPGQLRRNSLAHVARGADAVMFFQWRASRFGAEKFHSAMVPQAGTAGSTWREVTALGRDLQRLREVAGSVVRPEVGLLWDWESWWALELEYRPSQDLRYLDAVRQAYTLLWREHRAVDFVRPGAPADGYRLLVAPSLYLLSATAGKALRDYVENGGTLLVGPFSGIVDENDTIPYGPFPGGLRDLLGLSVDEFHPLRAGERVRLQVHAAAPDDGGADAAGAVGGGADAAAPGAAIPEAAIPGDTTPDVAGGGSPEGGDPVPVGTATIWSEGVVPAGAAPVWTFADGPDAGAPALTRHRIGAGTAWYLATRPDDATLALVLRMVAQDAALSPVPTAPEGVEVVRRTGAEADYLFLINHREEQAVVRATGTDLLTGCRHDGTVELPAGAVAVLRCPPDPSTHPRIPSQEEQ